MKPELQRPLPPSSRKRVAKGEPSGEPSDLKSWIEDVKRGRGHQTVELKQFDHLELNVQAIRQMHGLTRQAFASRYGLSLRTVENWEKSRREPEGPAKSFLIAIAFAPQAVADAIRSYRAGELPKSVDQQNEDTAPTSWLAQGSEIMPVGQFTVGKKEFAIVPKEFTVTNVTFKQSRLNPLIKAAKFVVTHPKSDKGRKDLEEAVEIMEGVES